MPAQTTEDSAPAKDEESKQKLPKIDKAKLLRLRRQLILQSELTSAASEDENLAIEEVGQTTICRK